MRVFSRTAYLLRALWEGTRVAAVLGAAAGLTRLLSSAVELELDVAVLIALFTVGVLLRLTRPFRQSLFLSVYGLMIRSGIPCLVDLGAWELLLHAYQFWPGHEFDFAGLETLQRVHDSLDRRRRARILILTQLLSMVPHSPLARQAQDFLDAVGIAPPPVRIPAGRTA